MVKLTADLVAESPQFINAVMDRELNLRSFKIPVVENIGVTNNQFDTIDLAHNDIKKLENFPILPRLKHLFLPFNRVCYIQEDLHKYLPSLTTLSLINNNVQELGDLLPLKNCTKLTYLHLLGNPVAHKANYRLFVVHCLPQVRVLDFRRVRQQERDVAKKLFKGKKGAELRQQMSKTSVKSFTPGELAGEAAEAAAADTSARAVQDMMAGRDAAEVQRIKDAIASAKTLGEVEHLKQLLASGQLPVDAAAVAKKAAADGDQEMEEEEEDDEETPVAAAVPAAAEADVSPSQSATAAVVEATAVEATAAEVVTETPVAEATATTEATAENAAPMNVDEPQS